MAFYSVVRLTILWHWLCIFASSAVASITAATDLANLRTQLSPNASISWSTSDAPRWSDYDAPQPIAIINVAAEKDVQITVSLKPAIQYRHSILSCLTHSDSILQLQEHTIPSPKRCTRFVDYIRPAEPQRRHHQPCRSE